MLIRYGLGAALLASAAAAYAQSFPAKPVRVIVPFPAGGGLDITARVWPEARDYWDRPS
jgi:tripartite-type tricarboxylate transporter receptor subunit TctC